MDYVMPDDGLGKLDRAGNLARKWVEVYTADNRKAMMPILDACAEFSGLQMAYFCQQAVSLLSDVHKASMCLTVFTNRLAWTPIPIADSAPARLSEK